MAMAETSNQVRIKNLSFNLMRDFIFLWWRGVESNYRHKAFQASALPLSYPAMGYVWRHYREYFEIASFIYYFSIEAQH